jgi:hypothetical protein
MIILISLHYSKGNKISGGIMRLINRDDLHKEKLPGRIIQKAVGKGSFSTSKKMTMGFARYSEESGPM